MPKSVNSKSVHAIKKDVMEYMQLHFGGKTVYIPVNAPKKPRRTQIKAVNVLRRAGWDDKDICKVMHIYPSYIAKLEAK